MSQINLANWEIIDDTANNQIVIRSQNTGEELRFSDSAQLSISGGAAVGGAFTDDDSDGIAELLTSFNGVQVGDDEQIQFGANSDLELQYDSSNDDLRITDATNTNDILALDRTTGDLSVAGTLTEGATL